MADRADSGGVRQGTARRAAGAMFCLLVCLLGVGACARGRVHLSTPPSWMNSVVTAHEQVNVAPAMTVAQRWDELRRAKEAAYRQLVEAVCALPLSADHTILASLEARPELRPQVESYIRRAAVIESQWQPPRIEIRATVEVGAELLELLEIKQTAPATDRTTPSTGIVRPY